MLMVVMMLMFMLMVMVVMTAAVVVIALALFFKQFKLRLKGVFSLNRLKHLLTVKLIPVCRNDNRVGVMLSYHRNGGIELVLLNTLCMRENDCTRVLYLVVEKLAEILHINLALVRVRNGREAVEYNFVGMNILNGSDNVA